MPEQRVHVWVAHFRDRTALQLQWIDPDTGKRTTRSARTADEKEAERAAADLSYELSHGKYQEASRMSWDRFRELFEQEYVSGLRPRTRLCYRKVLNLFEEVCHPTKLRAVSERTLSTFLAGMRQRVVRGRVGMMPSTMFVYLQYLGGALAWAVEQRLLPERPRLPTVKVPKKKPQPVPAEAFERLVAAAPDEQMRAFLLCGWLAGLRLNEAVTLAWQAVLDAPYLDLARGRIVLPAEFSKGTQDDWLPLHPLLREVLTALPRSGDRVFRFVTARGRPIRDDSVSARVVRLAKQARVRLTMHSLRRGFGCHHAARVSAHVLMRLMRHKNIATSLNYYCNFDASVEAAIRSDERTGLTGTEAGTGFSIGNSLGNTDPAAGSNASGRDPATPSRRATSDGAAR
jgi:integrase